MPTMRINPFVSMHTVRPLFILIDTHTNKQIEVFQNAHEAETVRLKLAEEEYDEACYDWYDYSAELGYRRPKFDDFINAYKVIPHT